MMECGNPETRRGVRKEKEHNEQRADEVKQWHQRGGVGYTESLIGGLCAKGKKRV